MRWKILFSLSVLLFVAGYALTATVIFAAGGVGLTGAASALAIIAAQASVREAARESITPLPQMSATAVDAVALD